MATSKRKTDINKKKVLECLRKTLGIVTSACKMANICRDQFYKWQREDAAFRKEVEDIEAITLDFAESKLHKKIQEEDLTAILFYLKCKGKKRGYIDRMIEEKPEHETDTFIFGKNIKKEKDINNGKN